VNNGHCLLDGDLSQITQQRVQVTPIINGVIPQQKILINSLEVMGHISEAGRQTSNNIQACAMIILRQRSGQPRYLFLLIRIISNF
jgi:hypothetical protein